jgi:hypothetical protein
MKDIKVIEAPFRDVTRSYFYLCQNICQEIGQRNNRDTVAFWEADEKNGFNPYDAIKWSGLRVVVPLLFNFYHGLELFWKYCIVEPKANHGLIKLKECWNLGSGLAL